MPQSVRTNRDTRDHESHPAERQPGVFDLLVLAICIGLLTGLVETALLAFARSQMDRLLRFSPQAAWQAPIAYAFLFAVTTAILLLVTRGRSSIRAVVFVTAWLGGAGILFLAQRLHQGAALVLAAGVASQVARFTARWPALARRAARMVVLPAALAVASVFYAVNIPQWRATDRALAALPPATPGAPNVLLIIWDTVRAASLSAYGYSRETTPSLARTAADGVLFQDAFSTAPWTTPAHASLFTGLYPAETSVDWLTPLDAEPRTLAEVLAASGYRTAGFTANTFATSRASGLDRGFSHYDDFHLISGGDLLLSMSLARSVITLRENWLHWLGIGALPGSKPGRQVSREFLQWLDETPGRPFFAFLNYFDAHVPYLPPAPFDTLFGPRFAGRNPHLSTGRRYTGRELQAEVDAYDGAIRFLDTQLDSLVRELETRGLLDNTILVVTSDHGEEFGEHDIFTHGRSVYDAVLRVPLVIRYPAKIARGTRVRPFVTIRDVPTTILDLAGLRVDAVPGRSLARWWSTAVPSAPDTVFASVDQVSGNPPEYPVSRSDLAAVFVDPYKLILAGDEVLLFDLRRDPSERDNLSGNTELRGTRDSLTGAAARYMARRKR